LAVHLAARMAKKSKAAQKGQGKSVGKQSPGKAGAAAAAKAQAKPKAKAKAKPFGAAAQVLRAGEIGDRQEAFAHPWNLNSEMYGVQLGRAAGLKRLGVSIVRIPPGKESFVPHAHQCEEEWVYLLMGRAAALCGAEEIEIGAGDFVAYPAPQAVHHLRNIGDCDLVYLMGGENAKVDVVDYPAHDKRMLRVGEEMTIYPLNAGAPLDPPKAKKKSKKR
jgi:uncharacterized cupin superfamily protein